MKRILPFLAVMFIFAGTLAANDSLTNVFIRKSGKNNLSVLRMYSDGTYDHCKYTKTKIYHDYGTFVVKRKRITFTSDNKKRGFPSVGGKNLFISTDGIYTNRWDCRKGTDPMLTASFDTEYHQEWTFNPLAGKDNAQVAKTDIPEPVKFSYDSTFNAAEFVRSYYVNLTGKYSPEYKPIIEKHYCGPGCYFSVVNGQLMAWSGDTTGNTLFSEFETMVHETAHQCNGFGNCLIRPGLEINMDRTATFNSSEFKAIVPEGASVKIFRYNTYVGDDSKVSANVSGIYGLMDEFSAYQNGCSAAVAAAETALSSGDKAKARKFLDQACGTYFAYYEFRLFIAWYLEYAQQKYPEMHQGFMNNKNLRVAFTLNDQRFQETIAKLSALDIKTSTTGTAHYFLQPTYAAFAKTEVVNHEKTLNGFRVAGVNYDNYKTFLNKP